MKLNLYVFWLPPSSVVECKTKGWWIDAQVQKLQTKIDRAWVVRAYGWHDSIELPPPRLQALQKLFRLRKPGCIITLGQPMSQFPELCSLSYEFRKLWIPQDVLDVDAVHAWVPNNVFLNAAIPSMPIRGPLPPIDASTPPLISFVTTSYLSGHRKHRPHESITQQTNPNWEWVIVQDLPSLPQPPSSSVVLKAENFATWKRRTSANHARDEAAECAEDDWKEISEWAAKDSRIRAFRTTHRDSYIGSVKQVASSLARGVWLCELDHDDRIVPELAQWLVDVMKQYPNVGFIWGDAADVREGTDEPLKYVENHGCGFGSYLRVWCRGKWQNVAQTPRLNPITMREIPGVPNHVRAWRSDVYQAVGGHAPALPVADDFELIVRTILGAKRLSYRCVRIAELTYLQYSNIGGNNYTEKRRHLIQDLTRLTRCHHEPSIAAWVKEQGWPDERVAKYSPHWFHDQDLYLPRFETVWKPNLETTVTVVIVTLGNTAQLQQLLSMLWKTTESNNGTFCLEVLVIGRQCTALELFMSTPAVVQMTTATPQAFRLRWWNLQTCPTTNDREAHVLAFNYALKMLVHTTWVACLVNDVQSPGVEAQQQLWTKACTTAVSGVAHNKDVIAAGVGVQRVLLVRHALFVQNGYWSHNQEQVTDYWLQTKRTWLVEQDDNNSSLLRLSHDDNNSDNKPGTKHTSGAVVARPPTTVSIQQRSRVGGGRAAGAFLALAVIVQLLLWLSPYVLMLL